MTGVTPAEDTTTGRLRIPRSRGALVGALLVLLGSWGALVPFLGQQLGLGYASAGPWEWTAARGWLQVLPGLVTIAGGVILMMSRNRFTAVLGAWLGALAGVWFVVGRVVAAPLGIVHSGANPMTGSAEAMWVELVNFSGLGVAIVLLAAAILGRLSVRSVRDIRYAETTASDNDERLAVTGEHRRRLSDVFGRRNTTPAH